MAKLIKKRSGKIGLPPGALIHIGEKKTEKTRITIIDYDEMQLREKEAASVEECIPFKDKSSSTVTWINVDGLHQVELVENLCKYFEVHHLITEDILNTDQRPKIEEFEGYLYIILKMFCYKRQGKRTHYRAGQPYPGDEFCPILPGKYKRRLSHDQRANQNG